MNNQLTAKEIVNNVINELCHASELIDEILISNETDEFACRKCTELNELKDNITRTLHDEIGYLRDKINMNKI